MTPPFEPEHSPKLFINTNTYFSLGLIALSVGGIWAILSAITSTKTEISSTRTEIVSVKQELNLRFDKMEDRVKNLESSKNIWTATDMFKWAVHLQQQNPNLKVPEPEVNTK